MTEEQQGTAQQDTAQQGTAQQDATREAPESPVRPDARPAQPDQQAQPAGTGAGPSEPDASGTAASFEPLTVTYERLRHTDDVAQLHEYARRPLPDRAQQAAFSRATALLEAVAGNQHTPLEDRVFLASDMPFPNILVKLSDDPAPEVRKAVAANQDDKNWLVGRLTKDPDPSVRDAALRNPRTSWKMRLEGAQNPELDSDTLDFLSTLGVSCEPGAPAVLAQMVRRAVALNPHVSAETLQRLGADPASAVAAAARRALAAAQENG